VRVTNQLFAICVWGMLMDRSKIVDIFVQGMRSSRSALWRELLHVCMHDTYASACFLVCACTVCVWVWVWLCVWGGCT